MLLHLLRQWLLRVLFLRVLLREWFVQRRVLKRLQLTMRTCFARLGHYPQWANRSC